MAFIFIYVTVPKKYVEKISLHLLKKRLVACLNAFPVRSMYRWKGKIEKTSEVVLILKTVEKNYAKVEKEIKKLHPYSVPFIAKIKMDLNKEYAEWINSELK
jgi:periplasmic divalent cation tolerance protein